MGHALEFYASLHLKMQERLKNSAIDKKVVIQVGSATCEKAAGSDAVKKEFLKLLQASGRDDVIIKQTGCTGRCAREPIVGVFVPGKTPIKYEQVDATKADQIFTEHVLGGRPVPELVLDKRTDKR
ncbi:(2Fe-2S) ferredoxin domain-containing protein, partial [bacterium]|nr:(2Fe-2S) ferredoxin domain-containing protein [bacterium]